MIYVLDDVLGYKIGWTARSLKERWPAKDMRKRVVLVIEPGGAQLEAELHRKFAGIRVGGTHSEHFALLPEHLTELASLPGARLHSENWDDIRPETGKRDYLQCGACKTVWRMRLDRKPKECPRCKHYTEITVFQQELKGRAEFPPTSHDFGRRAKSDDPRKGLDNE